MDEGENQINNLEYKETKNTQSGLQEEKGIQKCEDSVRSLWDNFKCTNIGITAVLEEERTRNWKPIWKNNERNLPWLGEGTRYTSPGSTESPKQDEPKEAHNQDTSSLKC